MHGNHGAEKKNYMFSCGEIRKEFYSILKSSCYTKFSESGSQKVVINPQFFFHIFQSNKQACF